MRLPVSYALVGLLMSIATEAAAQTSPTPGPTNPVPPPPQSNTGGTIVVNPTEEECRKGWNEASRWTKEQFEEFCHKLGASK